MSEDINKIDWESMTGFPENEQANLKDVNIGDSHQVTFHKVKQVGTRLVAEIESDTLPGDHLWLRGTWGAQNGLMSLIKAANGGENIEGKTFTYTKVKSEKSPAGYAHSWKSLDVKTVG